MSAKILAVDTATENCSVALVMGDQVFARSEEAPRDHTKKILPMVDEVLKEANIALTDIDAIAFGQGPGSFTGVRIGIGIAQGLAFGADLPMIGVSTLAAMAQGSYRKFGETHVATAIDARMSEVYWARYSREQDGRWTAVDAECVTPPSELAAHLEVDSETWAKVGTGWEAYTEHMDTLAINTKACEVLFPEAQDMAFLAQFAYSEGKAVSAEESEPVYLRDKVTWKKLPGRE